MKMFAMIALTLVPAIAQAQFGVAKSGSGSEIAAEVKGRNLTYAEQIPPPKRALTYKEAWELAASEGMELHTYYGTPLRETPGAISVYVDPSKVKLPDIKAGQTIIAYPDSSGGLYYNWREYESEVSRQATPFASRYAGRDDDGPWLGRAEQDRIKAAWPVGLAFPKDLKFYSLPRRYQRLYTMSSRPYNDIVPLEDGSLQFVHSGGLAGVDQSEWISRKGLAIPEGSRISVWQEYTDVRAFALTPRWRWQFPAGTVAVDALFNADGKAFEIRTQTKKGDGWMTKVIHKDEDAAPRGYTGLKQSCASCHDYAEAVTNVPGRIYRHVIWGSDGRFSWRPFDESGNLDRRWPIEVQ